MTPDLQRLALRHLGASLAAALFLCLLGGGLLWASQQTLAKARRDQLGAREQAHSLHERYLATLRDEAPIRQTIARFDQLQAAGLIGPENRLDWANAVRHAAQNRRLDAPEFSIEPRRNLGQPDPGTPFTLSASRMKLSLGLLHEGELLRLLDDLARRPDAILHPRNCQLQRNASPQPNEHAALRAECELDWITVTPSSAESNAPLQP